MTINKSKAKVYIDGANIFYTQRKLKFSIDWVKMRNYLAEKSDILEMRYYGGVKENDEKMNSYLRYLDAIRVSTITKPLKVIKIDKDHILAKVKNFKEIYK